jgi:hypothetical protein
MNNETAELASAPASWDRWPRRARPRADAAGHRGLGGGSARPTTPAVAAHDRIGGRATRRRAYRLRSSCATLVGVQPPVGEPE